MSRIMKRSAAFAAAALTAVTISAAGAGTAGAAPARTCETGKNAVFSADFGLVQVAQARGNCAWLKPGMAAKPQSGFNPIVVTNIPLPDGTWLFSSVGDPTGLYPVTRF